MMASFSAEILKLRTRPAVWVVSAVWLSLGLLFEYVFPYLSYRGGGLRPQAGAPQQLLDQILPSHVVTTAIAGWPFFGGALILVLGVLLTGSEYGWGSLKTILAQGPRRQSVFAGKLLAAGALALLLVFAGFAAAAGVSSLIAGVESKPIDWPAAADVIRGMAAGWLILAMWSLAGMFLGVAFRGTSLAIGLGVVWVLAVEQIVRGFAPLVGVLDGLERWLPGTNAGSLVAGLGVQPGAAAGVTTVVDGIHALLVVAAYVIGFSLLAVGLVLQRDVV